MKRIHQAKRFGTRLYLRAKATLHSNAGNGEMTGMLILVLIVVVVGAILLVAFGDQVKSMMSSVGEKIEEMFDYT